MNYLILLLTKFCVVVHNYTGLAAVIIIIITDRLNLAPNLIQRGQV